MPTRPQLRKIWGAAREIRLEEEALRDQVEAIAGHRRISKLTFAQADQLIELLVRLGATAGPGKRKPSGRRRAKGETKLISGEVRALIEDLRGQLGGKWLEDPYFAGACKRLFRKARPATAAEGARVVEMLKQRIAHDEQRA